MVSMISCLFNLIEWNSKYSVTRGILSESQSSRTLCRCIFLVSLLHEYLYPEKPHALYATSRTTRVESLGLRGGCGRILSCQSFLSSLPFPLPYFSPSISPSFLFPFLSLLFLLLHIPPFLSPSFPSFFHSNNEYHVPTTPALWIQRAVWKFNDRLVCLCLL